MLRYYRAYQYNDVRSIQTEFRQGDTGFLSTRQVLHANSMRVASQPKSTQLLARFLVRQVEQPHQIFGGCLFSCQMFTGMLVELSEFLWKMDIRWFAFQSTINECVCIHTIRWFIRISPTVGCKSPVNSLRNVDLPTPLGPTIATRELKSTPKSTFLNKGFWLGYAKSVPVQLNEGHNINWWHFIL